ncbi:MAG: hypothetical protein IAE99_08640 [Rhodothermales bacterium]|nr:hypothetical protein [Rhodothermales bacterium]
MTSPDHLRQDPSGLLDTARHEVAEHAAMAAQDRAATANDRVRVERLVGALGLDTSRAPVMVAPTHSEPVSSDSLVAVQDNGVTRGINILVMGNGCVHATRHGMGTSGDQTAPFRAALAEARAGGACLLLPPGDITVAAPQPIDLGTLRALEGQNTRVTFTGIPSGQRTLNARGQRRVLASRLRTERGTTELRLPAGLTLRPGQMLLFVSGEPTPYASIDYYGRGERNVVADYDARSGRLVLVSPLLYTYRSGQHTFASGARTNFDGVTVLAVDEHALDFGDGLTLVGPNTNAVGAWLAMCRVASAARFENWGNTGLNLSACTGRVEGSIFSGWYAGSGNAYGVCVGDLSRITVSADVAGGRHAVASGGGGEFTRQEAGSTQTGGRNNTGLALPSVLHVIGGEYRATSQQPVGAIDAHGIVEELIIVGATVHEGIQASARKSSISNCTIYHQGMAGVYMTGTTGGYVPDGEAHTWGDLDVNNCRIESVGTAQLASVQVMQGTYAGLRLSGVRIRGRFEQNDRNDVYRTWLSVAEEGTTIRRVDIEADALLEGNPRWALIRLSHRPVRIRVAGNVPLLVLAQADVSYEVEVDLDLSSSPRETYGVSLFGGQDVALSGRVVGARWSGARIEAKRVEASGIFENNGRDPAGRSSEEVRAALVVKADEINLRQFTARDTQRQPTQAYGVVALPTQTRATVRLIDADVKAPTQGRSFVLRQGVVLDAAPSAASAETSYPEAAATASLGTLRPGESRAVPIPLAGARQGSLALARRTDGGQRGLRVTADVTSDDTVTLIVTNTSPAAQNLGTTQWQVRVVQL